MTPYDAAMVGVVVAGMVWGAFRGITWQLASLLSLVLGYTMAQPLSGMVVPYLPGEPVVARAIAMIVVYFGVSSGIFLIAWLIRATLRRLQFEAYDRHLGMVLGGLEGALLGLVATLFVVSLAPSTRNPIFESPSGRVVGRVMASLGPVLPEEARKVLAPFWTPSGTAPAIATEEHVDTLSKIAELPRISRTQHEIPRAPVGRDDSATPASLGKFLEESERKIGKAVIDGASEGLRRATRRAGVGATDGTTQRR